jgi:hypothetical protein
LTDVRGLAATIGRWFAVGSALGTVATLALLAVTSPKGATDTGFALGALVLGFGVTTWAGAVGLGRTIEGVRGELGISSTWTQAGARQAFTVLSWTGAGWMLAAVVLSFLLGVA